MAKIFRVSKAALQSTHNICRLFKLPFPPHFNQIAGGVNVEVTEKEAKKAGLHGTYLCGSNKISIYDHGRGFRKYVALVHEVLHLLDDRAGKETDHGNLHIIACLLAEQEITRKVKEKQDGERTREERYFV